jgi:hypothetical protein
LALARSGIFRTQIFRFPPNTFSPTADVVSLQHSR